MTNGVFANSSGTIESVVYGFSGATPIGLTFTAVADPSGLSIGMTTANVFNAAAKADLDASDTTVHRIAEGVALGLTTWTTADVVAWMNYRRALRSCISVTQAGTLPARPPYPVGT